MSINSPEQFEVLRACGVIVGKALRAMAMGVRAGVTTAELCEIGSRVLAEHGAQSSPPTVYGFPAGRVRQRERRGGARNSRRSRDSAGRFGETRPDRRKRRLSHGFGRQHRGVAPGKGKAGKRVLR